MSLTEQPTSKLYLSDTQRAEVLRRLTKPVDLVPDAEMNSYFRKLVSTDANFKRDI